MPMIFDALRLLLILAMIGLILWAMLEDIRSLMIPNRISLALVALFLPWAALTMTASDAGLRLSIAAITFALTYLFWLAGKFGGGDVKFLSSLMLWVPPLELPFFLLVLSIVSLCLAIGLLSLRGRARKIGDESLAEKPWGLRRAYEMARVSACPYAVPIGCAGLAVLPALFAH